MKLRAFVIAAALPLAACGGTNSDEDNQNVVETNVTSETMGENGAMMNDMTTANDVAISNQL
jgi:ABC-type glycerol-3-phosphate transport system substrate-binding protein